MQQHIDEVLMVQTVLKTVEAPPLQFIDAVGDIPVMVQREISMVQTEIEALQFQGRAMSNESQEKTSGNDEFFSQEKCFENAAG